MSSGLAGKSRTLNSSIASGEEGGGVRGVGEQSAEGGNRENRAEMEEEEEDDYFSLRTIRHTIFFTPK